MLSTEILVLDPQRTQRITGSVFQISLQPDWRSRQTKQRPFLTGQSWRILKSGYTAGSPEQGFRRCFADGVNQSLISSARRLEKKERTERDLCQASDAFFYHAYISISDNNQLSAEGFSHVPHNLQNQFGH